ncbi:chitin elicitor receptor kinase 1 [Quercus suber]|uniref:Chitin elicitor receptor kinase 1 n=1 Tax=Quercus suber TaxID=58331 RepID=A0AAW0L2X7_QUESU
MIQFEDGLSQSDSEDLRKVVDPRLGDNCPFDSVRKLIRPACQSMHTRNSSTKAKHEVYSGCTNDTFIFN